MKNSLILLLALVINGWAQNTVDEAKVAAQIGENKLVIEAHGVKPKAPLFYHFQGENEVLFQADTVSETIGLNFEVVQGEAEALSVELQTAGRVLRVEGEGLKSWALRKNDEGQFLDLVPLDPKGRSLKVVVSVEQEEILLPGSFSVTTVGLGGATSFSATYRIESEEDLRHQIEVAKGVRALDVGLGRDGFVSSALAEIAVGVRRKGSVPDLIEMKGLQLRGVIDEEAGVVNYLLRGTAKVNDEDLLHWRLLDGFLAPSAPVVGDGYRLGLRSESYHLEFEGPGTYQFEIPFVTPISEEDGVYSVRFEVFGPAIIPMTLSGFEGRVTFNPRRSMVPVKVGEVYEGFVSARGSSQFLWQREAEEEEGDLFFTSEMLERTTVSSGLIRQNSRLRVKTLQGALSKLRLKVAGTGQVLKVSGGEVLEWKLLDEGILEVQFSQPVEDEAVLEIESQVALAKIPASVAPLQLTPEGAVRHSGYLEIYNEGAVRFEVREVEGMSQLSPEQFPGAKKEGSERRQSFYFRYPARERSFSVSVAAVEPEINLSQTLLYGIGETDRTITADLQLDIREVPILEWDLFGPENYAVVSVEGASDYLVSEAEDGQRRIRLFFERPMEGLHLVRLRLERNIAAGDGQWSLPVLSYPGSQVIRGELGIAVTPGYRVTLDRAEDLAEMPLNHFLKKTANLQLAYRVRAEKWKAEMTIQSLSRNVQADTFHLVSLKEGRAYASVLLNYLVTGAPVDEWRFTVPEGAEHVEVDGQDVRDSRRDGSKLIVPLNRPVMGTYQLLVSYEIDAGAEILLGGLTPVGADSERGFVQVVSPAQVDFSAEASGEALIKLDPLELPTEYQLMSPAPSLGAWQYSGRPFQLRAKIDWLEAGEIASQVVEHARFVSSISRDGGVMTESTFDLRTRERDQLEFQVDRGLILREVTVNGKAATVREVGDRRLVALPEDLDAQKPLTVMVRSTSLNKGKWVMMVAPKIIGTTQLRTSWQIIPDAGHVLEPVRATGLRLDGEFTVENGFSWIVDHALKGLTLIVFAWVLGFWVSRIRARVSDVGAALVVLAAIASVVLALNGFTQQGDFQPMLSYQVPVSAPDQTLSVAVHHFEEDEASVSDLGTFVMVVGLLLGLAAWKFVGQRGVLVTLAILVFAFGALSQVGGAGYFFLGLAALILAFWWTRIRPLLGRWRETEDDDYEGEGRGAATVLMVLFFSLCGMGQSKAEEVGFDALIENWVIQDERLTSTGSVKVTGEDGERFLFLKSPAVMADFQSEGLEVIAEGDKYYVVPLADGSFEASFRYQAPANKIEGGLPLYSGAAVMHSVTVQHEDEGWAINSDFSVRTKQLEGEGSSAELLLVWAPDARVKFSQKTRDVSEEKLVFYSEVSDLYVPQPGVVEGYHLIEIRPSKGEVKNLSCLVPEGMTVASVKDLESPPGEELDVWSFDPSTRVLKISLPSAKSETFRLMVETERALPELPTALKVTPLKVLDSEGEVGVVALVVDGGAQLDQVETEGMTSVNVGDFDRSLFGGIAPPQRVFRRSAEEASLELRVTPVAPEVRVSLKQRLSIGDERTVLAAEMAVSITRAGIFQLSFVIPEGLEVETLSGEALDHWVEVEEGGQRIALLNLKEKTLGQQAFSVTLAAPTEGMPAVSWAVPKLLVREASRHSGELVVLPGRGIQVSVKERRDLSMLDPKTLGTRSAGALAFRILQKSWALILAVDQLEASIRSEVLQEVDLRDGRTMTQLYLALEIENSSLREFEVVLPELSEVAAQTVRASGNEVRDLQNIEGNRWMLKLKRRVIGETLVRIDFEENEEVATISTCHLPLARQEVFYLALRQGARLELEVLGSPGWSSADWGALPKRLHQVDQSSAPSVFFKSSREPGLVRVQLKRHAVVTGSKLRVKEGTLLTVLSSQGELVNQLDLKLETLQRGAMHLDLPTGSRLFGVFVNDESPEVVRDGESWRFYLSGDAGRSRANLRVVYATTLKEGSLENLYLQVPKIGEPLENVRWTISVPEGYRLADAEGDLDYIGEESHELLTRDGYLQFLLEEAELRETEAIDRLDRAGRFLRDGVQDMAVETLRQVSNNVAVDMATNEDARIQMENLYNQQAILGLNTRRQRLFMSNRGVLQEDGFAERVTEAANANPIFSGKRNFGLDDYNNTLAANDAEVNRSLSRIASKWIEHQKIEAPITKMLDPVITSSGKSFIFTRELQAIGENALWLRLELEPEGEKKGGLGKLWFWILCGVILVFARFLFVQKVS